MASFDQPGTIPPKRLPNTITTTQHILKEHPRVVRIVIADKKDTVQYLPNSQGESL